MGKLDKDGGAMKGISRRDFLKTGAAVTAVGAAGLELAAPVVAAAATTEVTTYHTTCPYCSASCGQFVDVAKKNTGTTEEPVWVDDPDGAIVDIYGDNMSPFNDGGLCAKGAGTYQLVNNKRRIGAFAGTHPVNPVFAYDATYDDGVAYKRTGDGAWGKMALQTALDEIAVKMVAARGTVDAGNGYNSKSIAFFGSSHVNNEQNYTYRRLIAQFGTSNVEHQARI